MNRCAVNVVCVECASVCWAGSSVCICVHLGGVVTDSVTGQPVKNPGFRMRSDEIRSRRGRSRRDLPRELR